MASDDSDPVGFRPQVLRECALVADGERGVLRAGQPGPAEPVGGRRHRDRVPGGPGRFPASRTGSYCSGRCVRCGEMPGSGWRWSRGPGSATHGRGELLAEHQQGDQLAAVRYFERNGAACGPLGLLSEEYDVTRRQLRDDLPPGPCPLCRQPPSRVPLLPRAQPRARPGTCGGTWVAPGCGRVGLPGHRLHEQLRVDMHAVRLPGSRADAREDAGHADRPGGVTILSCDSQAGHASPGRDGESCRAICRSFRRAGGRPSISRISPQDVPRRW